MNSQVALALGRVVLETTWASVLTVIG